MTDVLIKRELLERCALLLTDSLYPPDGCANFEDWTAQGSELAEQIRTILAAPRQPEGDSISLERVQAEADAFFDWPTADKSSVTTKSCLIFARCIAGMVAAERDAAIAELREECERLRKDRSSCWAEFKVMTKACLAAEAERDTLRQQLAKLQGEYEWVVSINEALNESNIRAWADLTFLAEYVVGREYGTALPNYEALGRYPLDVAEAAIGVTPSTPLTISTADIQSPSNKD